MISATSGQIIFDQALEGNSMVELFNKTKFVYVKSYSAVLKYSYIRAYSSSIISPSTLLWHAHCFGGGVATAGYTVSKYHVNFK